MSEASDNEAGRWEPDEWDEEDEVSDETNEFEEASAESEESESEPEAGPSRPIKRQEDPPRQLEKRSNKNAPMAVSSKKQVSRFRQVIDVPEKASRDPRFSSLSAGQEDAILHSKSYSFIPEMLQNELDGLRTAVKMAQKAERTCSWTDKPARTAERERLELELTRLRTRIDRGRTEARERSALSKAKKEEREKREQGKGAWFMKKGERKNVLLKSRFDELEAKGKTAVKKALEKKRRQTAQKEKKSRPGGKRRSAE